MTKRLAVLAVILLGGCDLYFNGDDQPPCTYYGTGSGSGAPAYELRNPETGQCESQYPEYPCDGTCGPCAGIAEDKSQLDWGACYGMCSGLDYFSCSATPGCFAAYVDNPNGAANSFWGCWDTAPSGPVGGSCENLDAQACSTHDNCIAVYDSGTYSSKFSYCAPEPPTLCLADSDCGGGHCDITDCNAPPGCDPDCINCGGCPDICYGICVPAPSSCTDVDCGVGHHCEQQCVEGDATNQMEFCGPVCVQNTTCESVDCAPGYTCAELCDYDANGNYTCQSTCVPDANDPGECYGAITCLAASPACPSGTTPGVRDGCYTGYCIPVADCGPNDPGECYGEVNCLTGEPACPSGTTAGVLNGCWSGYCIPTSQCPLAPCETLSSEPACSARTDCTPVYTGASCTCYPDHCDCQVLTYDRCEAL